MANRIGPVDPGTIGKAGGKVEESGTSRKVSGRAGAAEAPQGRAAASDTVELTSGAQLLERLEKSLAGLPDVDSARVAEVKAAIENGEYRIDADAIADAMIRLERSFGE